TPGWASLEPTWPSACIAWIPPLHSGTFSPQGNLNTRTTNDDGRCPGLITRENITPAVYKMRFETGQYWGSLGETSFYPYVEIVFTITDHNQKFHVPLLCSRFSYTTYRGS
ncbi:5-hydroxyisourate hydrolase-like, partial [Oncorhynchus nerka]|uniref:5-hydroxyisourate hydrolase-like n=1 Tax=Oncorhynchus nerka TaxID=8023 RepID=UPI0031B88BBD